MSRSKHTRPPEILAADRVRNPRDPRGRDDASSFRRIARILKECGVVPDNPTNNAENPESEFITDASAGVRSERLDEANSKCIIPRVVTKRPRQGFTHPAKKADIIEVLQFFGEQCFYGLRSIKLVQGQGSGSENNFVMGRLEIPGTIILFDQADSPWFINGRILADDAERLESAGAIIERFHNDLHCQIHWNDEQLKYFMLFDVFMHEVGHHMIQQYKGKRTERVARTKDHEDFAIHFAQKCRKEFFEWQNHGAK